MNSRSQAIDQFLSANGWHGAERTMLAGDASFRKYERVTHQGRQAVLMDAPPEHEDIAPFVNVAEQLLAYGLSAPAIIAQDREHGFLLLEDLGDDLFSRVLKTNPEQETEFYLAAADVLIDLYTKAETEDYRDFQPHNEAALMRECKLFSEWFLPGIAEGKVYEAIWANLLPKLPALRPVLTLRDYHADNLLWLSKRQGHKRVGLLDFQDALIGSPAYDMVSFLEDARRDVKPETAQRVIDYFCAKTGIAKAEFMLAYALLGAQRNCKIIGVFSRLAKRDGKAHYLSYLPRVWKHLEHDVEHPTLLPLKQWLDAHVPSALRQASPAQAKATA